MNSPRLACLSTIFLSTALFAQSNPKALIGLPPVVRQNPVSSGLTRPDPAAQEKIVESYGKLPLSFEVNQGQADGKVKFLSRSLGYTLFLTGDEAIFSFRGKTNLYAPPARGHLQRSAVPPINNSVLRMKFIKANPAAKVTGAEELPGKINYFVGNDPKKWRSDVPTYAKVKYEGVYPGIDLVYYGNRRQLEYDFIVAPGADPRHVQFDVSGAGNISRDASGELVLQIGKSEVRLAKPVVYQEKDGKKQDIAAHYVLKRRDRVGFEVAGYDLQRPLFIDPLVYSTYLGGSGNDSGVSIAVDSSGSAYVTGATYSTDFPTTPGAFQTMCGGGCSNNTDDAFVTKLNPTGSTLVYSTYLGGSNLDQGQGIAVDSSGDAYVAGTTYSTDFPTTPGAFQTTCGGGCADSTDDAFVTELNPTGSALVYSTYLGGSGNDAGASIAVDSSGSAYITGATYSTDFPTTPGAFQTMCGGGCSNNTDDAFVTKLNPAGSALVYSTYLGGSYRDGGNGIAVDSSGDGYVTGATYSTDFPITPGAFQTVCNGGSNCNESGDAFVTELNPTGSALVYSTYLGGSYQDVGNGIAVNSSGDAYVTGTTSSYNFPITTGAFQTTSSGVSDAFVTELNPAGSALVYSTYLGGSNSNQGQGIAVDSSGYAHVAGGTASIDFPLQNPLQPLYGGGPLDAFVATLNPTGSALAYSTYLGGTYQDVGNGIAVDGLGDAFIAGTTYSYNFPITPGAFQTTCGECPTTSDAFLALISPSPFVTLFPLSLNFGNQNVGTSSSPQNLTLTDSGDAAVKISSIVATGDFSQTNTCPVGGILAAGSSCTIAVTFTPTGDGNLYGSVLIGDSAPGSPQSVPLTGVGISSAVTLTPPNLNFGDQTVNTTSAPQVSTLMNTGNSTLTITSIGSDSSEFAETNNCSTSIPVGGSCQITVTFTPSAAGTQNGAVKIVDNAPNSPQFLPLSGVGVLPTVTFSPTSLTFATQLIYTTSPAQKVTLTNTGLGTLMINGGGVSGEFGATTTCGKVLDPGGSCTISVTFKPRTKGTLNGDVSVTDNAPGSPQKLPLTGVGTYVQLSPASVNFGTQPINTTSVPKYITLVNKGSSTVNFTGTGISITGTDEGDFAETNNCGTSVPSGGNCRIKVTFTPTQEGKRTADVSVSDDGGGSPQLVPLMGTGTP